MNKILASLFAIAIAVGLTACGGGGGSEPAAVEVAAADTTLPAAPATTAAVANVPFTFPAGVPGLGTTGTTTIAFTNTATTPAFSITTPTGTATGTTRFGSCVFAVAAITGTVGTMKVGDTITVNP